MANLKTLLLLSTLAITIFVIVTTVGTEPCTDVASLFLAKLKAGETPALLYLFGENSCHCQPRGGFVAYLKYESGENDNLAFLFGHNFQSGSMSVKLVPTVEKVKTFHLPWEAPESTELDIPVSFDRAVYSPYYLPLDSAYGYAVKKANLDSFCSNPGKDFWKALSLRLRPSVQKGVVAAAAKADSKREPEFMADFFKDLISADQAKYLRPADAGEIIADNGRELPVADFANMLPRLKRGTLRLYVGRRGKFHPWAVKKGRLKDPVFELAGGKELCLITPEGSLVDIHGPAAPASENASALPLR